MAFGDAPDDLDSMILAEVTSAMTVKGYERLLDPSEENLPDVYVTVATSVARSRRYLRRLYSHGSLSSPADAASTRAGR